MLFNKDNNGSEELQQITGYYAAANQFSVIQTEVEDATRVVAGLVGPGVVAAADAAYQGDTAQKNKLKSKVKPDASKPESKSSLLTRKTMKN